LDQETPELDRIFKKAYQQANDNVIRNIDLTG